MVRRLCIALVSVAICAAASAGVAQASTAHVAITGGGLSMSDPSVTVVGRDPTELDLKTIVTDARGTGSGWFLSLAATSPGAPASSNLVVTGADAACASGSDCSPPVNSIAYPLTASLTGARTLVFEATHSSGMGAQAIDLHFAVPSATPANLNFALSISTPPSTAAPATGSTSVPCSIPDLVDTGTCPQAP